jgi:hypothetical protein
MPECFYRASRPQIGDALELLDSRLLHAGMT